MYAGLAQTPQTPFDNFRFYWIRLNVPRFRIIHITKRRKAGPFATPEFLAKPALYILGQIVRVIFRLAKGDLKHKQALRSFGSNQNVGKRKEAIFVWSMR